LIARRPEMMEFSVQDMTCNHCKMHVEKACKEVKGVKKVTVNLETKKVLIEGDPDRDQIYSAVKEAGYTPS
jgi:copper ion binding protein